MLKVANQFANNHLNKGTVGKITDYSFEYTTVPDKNEKVSTTVYMESYFLEL